MLLVGGRREHPAVAWPGSGARGHKTTLFFVPHKVTGNKAATELPQLLSQNTNMFREATAQVRRQTLCSSKVN